MAAASRTCEMKIPEDLVDVIEATPGGMKTAFHSIEKDFGLRTSSSYVNSKNFFIIGPNPDALELAIETLKERYGESQSEKNSGESPMRGKLADKQAVWKFQGDYASKAGHLFRQELELLIRVDSVNVKLEAGKLEITCSYTDLETVKPQVEKLFSDIDSLYEEHVQIEGSHAEMVRLHDFLMQKERTDKRVVIIWRAKEKIMSVYGRTEVNVKRALSDWTMVNNTSAARDTSPSPTYSSTNASLSKNEFKFPGGVLQKLESQRGGIQGVIEQLEREFGLHVSYVRKKHLVIMGPHLDLLELAAQSILHRHVLKQEVGIVGKLEGKNAVWKFLGTYARKVFHLFQPELKKLQRVRTVTIKAIPSKMNPNCVNILCSYRKVPIVKSHVEKIVGLVHTLHEKDVKLHKSVSEKQTVRLKEYIQQRHGVDKTVLCVFDEKGRTVHVYSRHEGSAIQTWGEIEAITRRHKEPLDMPDEYWHMFRQLYQMKVSGEVVRKLEQHPRGIMSLIQKIEKEYGVKTVYHRNKQMVLISPTPEVLELANETLASRYVVEAEGGKDRDDADTEEDEGGGGHGEDVEDTTDTDDKCAGMSSAEDGAKTDERQSGRTSRSRNKLPNIVKLGHR